MPRASLGPRLWLNPSRNVWVIRDGKVFLSTGCAGWKGAQERFDKYMAGREPEERARPAAAPIDGFIYFVTAEAPSFPIKIGFTEKANGLRIKALQTGCPYRVIHLATVPGQYRDEKELHRRFAGQRLQGEWFTRSEDLMTLIASYQTGGRMTESEAVQSRPSAEARP